MSYSLPTMVTTCSDPRSTTTKIHYALKENKKNVYHTIAQWSWTTWNVFELSPAPSKHSRTELTVEFLTEKNRSELSASWSAWLVRITKDINQIVEVQDTGFNGVELDASCGPVSDRLKTSCVWIVSGWSVVCSSMSAQVLDDQEAPSLSARFCLSGLIVEPSFVCDSFVDAASQSPRKLAAHVCRLSCVDGDGV